MYSTCTLNPAENEDRIRQFLKEHQEFTPLAFSLGDQKKSADGMMTILPYELHSDGFFIAKLLKK